LSTVADATPAMLIVILVEIGLNFFFFVVADDAGKGSLAHKMLD
jgi:hypothetical protein